MRLLTTPGGQPCRVYHTVPKRAYDVPWRPSGPRARGRPSPHRQIFATRMMPLTRHDVYARFNRVDAYFDRLEEAVGSSTAARSDIAGLLAPTP